MAIRSLHNYTDPVISAGQMCRCGHVVGRLGEVELLDEFEMCWCSCHWTDPRDTIVDVVRRLGIDTEAIREVLDHYAQIDVTTLNATERDALRNAHVHLAGAIEGITRGNGVLIEWPPPEPHIEAGIAAALETETDEQWRARLMCCQGASARRLALQDWTRLRRPLP